MRRILAVVAVALVAATATACAGDGIDRGIYMYNYPAEAGGGQVPCATTAAGGIDCYWEYPQRKGAH